MDAHRTAGLLAALLVVSLAPLSAAAAPPRPAGPPSHAPAHGYRETARPALPDDDLASALQEGELDDAGYALERALTLFDISSVRRRHGHVIRPDPHQATILLRDLAFRVHDLEGAEARLARQILARPDDKQLEAPDMPKYGAVPSKHTCPADPVKICLHWVEEGPHASQEAYVDTVLDVLTTVWEVQIETHGFRRPKDDSTSPNTGPNGNLDVYLADTGAKGIYGYCTSDDPQTGRNNVFDASAYCVLDNDFAGFPGSQLANLQATAAHEFFHAVQFAYDAFEDAWLLEGTAAVMEDVVFDDVNDNYQFLKNSQLVRPHIPADHTLSHSNDAAFMRRYGAWIFWRYLTEALSRVSGTDGAKLPEAAVIREIWERADASRSRVFNDEYSLQAAVSTAAARGKPFRRLFADYGVALQVPQLVFREGAAYTAYLETQPQVVRKLVHKRLDITPGRPSGSFTTRIDHLAHKYVLVERPTGIADGARVRLVFDLPLRFRGAAASVLSFTNTGVTSGFVRLNKDGDARITVPLGPEVQRVIIALTNASTRMKNCYRYDRTKPELSCGGESRDDGRRFFVRARLVNHL